MRERKIKIPAGGETQLRGNAKSIVVREAASKFRIVSDTKEEAVLFDGDNFEFEEVAKTVRFIDESGEGNTIVVVVSASGRGDLKSTAGSVTIENTEQLNAAAGDFNISAFSVDVGGSEILSASVTNRRVAVISTDGPVRISKTQSGPSFTVDGVLTHPASGALWASADEAVNVEVLEYLT